MTPTRLSLNCNFAAANFLDPLFTFSRASGATMIDRATGQIKTVAANVPRLEKDGLLIEGAATNLMPYQPNAEWNYWDCTYAGSSTAPDGSAATAWKFGSAQAIMSPISNVPSGPCTISLWIRKYTGGSNMNLRVQPDDWSTVFNSGPVRDANDADRWMNHWVRATITFNAPGGEVFFILSSDPGDVVAVACAQIEPGPAATSYIPTSGAPATRAAEACCLSNFATAPWWDPNRQTVVFEAHFQHNHIACQLVFCTDWHDHTSWRCMVTYPEATDQIKLQGLGPGIPHTAPGFRKIALSIAGAHAVLPVTGISSAAPISASRPRPLIFWESAAIIQTLSTISTATSATSGFSPAT